MDLRHLITFEGVLREGSFAGAAKALGCSQPTVTLHVQELERALGVVLFARQGRRPTLTEAGRALAARGRPVLAGLETLKRTMAELQGGVGGELRVGSIEPAASARLLPLLVTFSRARPRLKVRLEVGGTETISRKVATGQLDLGVCSPPPGELGLAFERVYAEEMALLVPARHALARARRVRARDLAGHRLLLTEQGCAYRRATTRSLGAAGGPVECGFEIGSESGLVAAVRHGLGVAIVPIRSARPCPKGTRLRRIEDADIALPVGLVRREDGVPVTPAAEAFAEALRAGLAGSNRSRAARLLE